MIQSRIFLTVKNDRFYMSPSCIKSEMLCQLLLYKMRVSLQVICHDLDICRLIV